MAEATGIGRGVVQRRNLLGRQLIPPHIQENGKLTVKRRPLPLLKVFLK